jgi:hypothetical protein
VRSVGGSRSRAARWRPSRRCSPPGNCTCGSPRRPTSRRTCPTGAAAGPFRPDAEFGVQYRSLDALAADNPGRLDPYRPLLDNSTASPPVWAFFGNSFVQAPGMLADTTRQRVPQRVVFNLGKNEPVPVRLAHAAFLLDSGLKPERVFVVFTPLDVHSFAIHGSTSSARRPAARWHTLLECRRPVGGWCATACSR